MKLETQRKQFRIVLNVPVDLSITEFESRLKFCADLFAVIGCKYAYIKHDKDVDKDTGVLKTLHYHFVLVLPAKKRMSVILYKFEDALRVSDSFIHIEESFSLAYDLQYLIHKNDIDKFQYDYGDIVTNFNEETLDTYFAEKVQQEITTGWLFKLVDAGYSRTEIMFIIGANNYNGYKTCIDVLINDKVHSPKLFDNIRERIKASESVKNEKSN